jgi:hypothetical protein
MLAWLPRRETGDLLALPTTYPSPTFITEIDRRLAAGLSRASRRWLELVATSSLARRGCSWDLLVSGRFLIDELRSRW